MKPKLDDIQEIARKCVGYYLRKLPSWASSHAADMMQEAVIAIFKAADSYDPNGADWRVYADKAAGYAVRRYLWRNRTAVVPARPERGGTPITAHPLEGAVAALVEKYVMTTALPDEQLNSARVSKKVREVLSRLDTSSRKQAVAVVLKEKTPLEVRRANQPMKEVRYAVKRLSNHAARSTELRNLWEELQA